MTKHIKALQWAYRMAKDWRGMASLEETIVLDKHLQSVQKGYCSL